MNVYDGSGTINAADSYTVKSLVTGTVLTADFELGCLLYTSRCV